MLAGTLVTFDTFLVNTHVCVLKRAVVFQHYSSVRSREGGGAQTGCELHRLQEARKRNRGRKRNSTVLSPQQPHVSAPQEEPTASAQTQRVPLLFKDPHRLQASEDELLRRKVGF